METLIECYNCGAKIDYEKLEYMICPTCGETLEAEDDTPEENGK